MEGVVQTQWEWGEITEGNNDCSLGQVSGVAHIESAPGSLDNSGSMNVLVDRLKVAMEWWEGVG